ncbi:7 transmembrane receptor (rhodopsin family) [Popillia japonica]|uniref:7 transmembrane receptor (Rhodopsin family) n=1 Tax=Popillia japonica TaxID=7064 RepID=A0AAW1I921_POPJA
MSMFDEPQNFTYNVSDYTNSTDFCESDETSSVYFRSAIYLMYTVIFVVATLAVGDLLITVFCVPFTSISYLKQYWSFGSFLCPVVNYSQAVAVFVSSYTLVAISIDRYMAIMWPLRPRMTKRLASLIILTVWIISMVTVAPILVFSKLTQPNLYYEACDNFPFNHSNISNEWVKAVRRENWKPSKHSKLYSDHFLSSDCKVSRAVREEN